MDHKLIRAAKHRVQSGTIDINDMMMDGSVPPREVVRAVTLLNESFGVETGEKLQDGSFQFVMTTLEDEDMAILTHAHLAALSKAHSVLSSARMKMTLRYIDSSEEWHTTITAR